MKNKIFLIGASGRLGSFWLKKLQKKNNVISHQHSKKILSKCIKLNLIDKKKLTNFCIKENINVINNFSERKVNYELVTSENELKKVLKICNEKSEIAIDCETNSLNFKKGIKKFGHISCSINSLINTNPIDINKKKNAK